MNKTKAITKFIIIMTVITLVFTGTGIAFAYFSADKDIPADINSGTDFGFLSTVNISVNENIEGTNLSPGQSKYFTANVTNTSIRNDIEYKLAVKADNINAVNAVILSIDGTVYGMLGDLITKQGDTYYCEMVYVLSRSVGEFTATNSHEIKLELHIGAESITNTNIEIGVVARTTVNNNYIFVKNEYEFKQALLQLKSGSIKGKTIALSSDIHITDATTDNYGNVISNDKFGDVIVDNYTIDGINYGKALAIRNDVKIDLCGHVLNMGGYSLVFDYVGNQPSSIMSRNLGGGIISEQSNKRTQIIYNTPNSIVYDYTIPESIDAVNVSGYKPIVVTYSDAVLADAVAVAIEEATKYGISNQNIYIGKGIRGYLFDLNDNIKTNSSGILTYNNSTSMLSSDILIPNDAVQNLHILIGTESRYVRVTVLSDKSVVDKMMADNVKVFYGSNTSNSTYINKDVFLPRKVKDYNAEISWESDNPYYFTNDGKFIAGRVEHDVMLYATVKYNGKIYNYEYKIVTAKMTSDELIRDISLNKNFILQNVGQTLEILTPEEIAELNSLSDSTGNTQITYRVPTELSGIISVKDNTLSLIKSTDLKKGNFTIIVSYTIEGVTKTVECNIKVDINLIDGGNVIAEAHKEVINHFNNYHGNNLHSFPAINDYKGKVDIIYTIPPQFILDGVTYNNDVDIVNSVSSSYIGDDYYILIDPMKLPNKNTTVYAQVSYKYVGSEEIAKTELVTFNVAGVYHLSDEDIADVSLWAKLRIRFDWNNDNIITVDEVGKGVIDGVADPDKLLLSNSGITSLKGLEYFTNFTEINLSGNKLTDISGLKNSYDLKILNLSNTGINDIGVLANLTTITTLNLSKNNITDLSAIKNMTNLNELNVSNNVQLRDITPILGMTNLSRLDASFTDVGTTGNYENNMNALITSYYNYKAVHNNSNPQYYRINSANTANWSVNSNMELPNKLLNLIVPIYEITSTIYVPAYINYNQSGSIVKYDIEWISLNTDVVDLVRDGDRFKVTMKRPADNTTIRLQATIKANGFTAYKFFDILSRGDIATNLYIEDSLGNRIDARTAVPDANLRKTLFDMFDTNKDNVISVEEIKGNTEQIVVLRNVSDLTGLEYFKNCFKSIDIKGCNLTDLSHLQYMSDSLETLYFDGDYNTLSTIFDVNNPISGLADINGNTISDIYYTYFNKLSMLNVYGADNVNSDDYLRVLFIIYYSRTHQYANPNFKLFKDTDGVTNTEWKPYFDALVRELSTVEGYYLLYRKDNDMPRVNAQDTLNLVLYGIMVKQNLALNYTFNGFSYARYDGTSKQFYMTQLPAADKYGSATLSATFGGNTVSRSLTVIACANYDLKVNTSSGLQYLHEVIPDETARENILSQIKVTDNVFNDNIITEAVLNRVTTLNFNNSSGSGIKGIELFENKNVTTLNIRYYTERDDLSLADIELLGSSLITLNITYSAIDLTKIIEKYSNTRLIGLTNLTINNCIKIVFKSGDINILKHWNSLTKVNFKDNAIKNFDFLSDGQNISDLNINNNLGAAKLATDIALNNCYANFRFNHPYKDYNYYVTSETVKWLPNGDIAERVKNVEPILNDTSILTPEMYGVNYIPYSSDNIIKVPISYEGYDIIWSTDYTDVLNISTVALNNYYNVTLSVGVMSAYVSFNAFIPALNKSIDYYLVMKGSAPATDATQFAIESFMKNDRFIDPYFAGYCMELLKSNTNSTSGVYSIESVNNITELNFGNSSSRKYFINDIYGISNFVNLQKLDLKGNEISDLTPIYNLNNLTDVNLSDNIIKSLWINGADGVKNSIFANMTNLKSIDISLNVKIDDYMAITKSTKNPDGSYGDNRSGLINLSQIYMQISAVPNITGYDYPPYYLDNEVNYFKFLIDWWNVKKVTSNADTTIYMGAKGGNIKGQNNIDIFVNAIIELYNIKGIGTPVIYTKADIELFTLNIISNDITYDINYTAIGAEFADNITINSGKVTKFTGVYDNIYGVNIPILAYITPLGITGLRIYAIVNMVYEPTISATPMIEVDSLDWMTYNDFYSLGLGNFNNATPFINADCIVKDGLLLNYLFMQYDTDKNNILSIGEREAVTSLYLTQMGFRDISGIELFYNLRYLTISGNDPAEQRITQLPDLPFRKSASLINNGIDINLRMMNNLVNIDGLAYDYDGNSDNYTSLLSYIKGLDITGMALDNSQTRHLANMSSIESLNLWGVRFNDMSFLIDIADTIQSIAINGYGLSDVSQGYGNRDNIIEMLLKASGKDNSGIPIVDNYGYSKFIGIDRDERIVGKYINTKEINIGMPTLLDSLFNAYGESFGIVWTSLAENGEYTVSGNTITVSSSYAGGSVDVQAQVMYGDKLTFKEKVTFIIGISDTGDEYIQTDGFFVNKDGTQTLLSDVMPDIALRYWMFKLLDGDTKKGGNANGIIEYNERLLSSVTANSPIVVGYVPNTSWIDNQYHAIVNDLTGIGLVMIGVQQITFNQLNTTDLTPILGIFKEGTTEPSITVLQVEQSKVSFENIDIIRDLPNLKQIALNMTTVYQINAIMDAPNLTNISNYGKLVISMHLEIALAYGRTYLKLIDAVLSDNMSNYYLVSSAEDKYAALVMGEIFKGSDFMVNSTMIKKDKIVNNTITLPQNVSYEGKHYNITYIPMSPNITFNGNNGAIKNDTVRNRAKFVARITINGANYERYFELEL